MNDTQITVAGNLTADPELRLTPSGISVANFTVASTPRSFDKATGEWVDGEAIFMRCTVWRQAAENLAEYQRRGDRVIVVGTLKSNSWEDKETGAKRSSLELNVLEVGVSTLFRAAKPIKVTRERDDLIARSEVYADARAAAAAAREPVTASVGSMDDEPPF